MSCNEQKISVIKATTLEFPLKFLDKNNVSIDISSWTISFFVKNKYEDTDTLISQNLQITDGPNGEAILSVNVDIALGDYVYRIKYSYGGKTFVLSSGIFSVIP